MLADPGAMRCPSCSWWHWLPSLLRLRRSTRRPGAGALPTASPSRMCPLTDGKVLMLADGSAVFAKAIGAELDLTDKGLGVRSRR